MANLIIRKYKNKNEKSSALGKTYGRVMHIATLKTNDICRHLQKHGTIYTSDVVKGVVEKFVNCFEELLLEGYKLKLDGLGTFYLTVQTKGEEKEEDFGADNIERVHVKFLPDKSKESEYTSEALRRKAHFADVRTLLALKEDDGQQEPANP
jgi:predicted histone-like DNA-binding protein